MPRLQGSTNHVRVTTAGGVLTVSVNGTQVLSSFDVFAAAGGANLAVVKSFPVTVTGGTLSLSFSGVKGDAMISAIELGQ